MSDKRFEKSNAQFEILVKVARDAMILSNVEDSLRADRAFMLNALKANPASFAFASKELRADKEFVQSALAAKMGRFPRY